MVFIDPETSMHVGTMGHVSSQPLHAHTPLPVSACIDLCLYLMSSCLDVPLLHETHHASGDTLCLACRADQSLLPAGFLQCASVMF